MVSNEFVEEILNRYIGYEQDTLKKIDKMDGSDSIGSIKWKMREEYRDRLSLLEDIKEEILG